MKWNLRLWCRDFILERNPLKGITNLIMSKMIVNTRAAWIPDASTGLESARIFSEVPCLVRDVKAYNSSGGTLYLMLFNAASVPANGEIPALIKPVATKQTADFDFGTDLLKFDAGLVAVLSTTDNELTRATNVGFFFARWK